MLSPAPSPQRNVQGTPPPSKPNRAAPNVPSPTPKLSRLSLSRQHRASTSTRPSLSSFAAVTPSQDPSPEAASTFLPTVSQLPALPRPTTSVQVTPPPSRSSPGPPRADQQPGTPASVAAAQHSPIARSPTARFSATRGKNNNKREIPPNVSNFVCDSDEDFEDNHVTPQSARRVAIAGSNSSRPLRDDRPSMTRRSAKKQKFRAEVVTTPLLCRSITLSENEDAYAISPIASAKSPARGAKAGPSSVRVTTTLFDGDRSELSSGTDNEDSRQPCDSICKDGRQLERAGLLIDALRASSVVIDGDGSSACNLEHTPSERTGKDSGALKINSQGPGAPRKPSRIGITKCIRGDGKKHKEMKEGTPMSRTPPYTCSVGSSTRKRGRVISRILCNSDSNDDDDDANRDGLDVVAGGAGSTERPGSSKRVVPDPPLVRQDVSNGVSRPRINFDDSSSAAECRVGTSGGPSPAFLLVSSPTLLRKRRRVALSSSSSDNDIGLPAVNIGKELSGEGDATPEELIVADTSEALRTPAGTRLLPKTLEMESTLALGNGTENVSDCAGMTVKSAIDGEDGGQIVGDTQSAGEDGDSEGGAGSSIRRSARLRSRTMSRRVLDVTPSVSPSPPSKRKSGRLQPLETGSDADEDGSLKTSRARSELRGNGEKCAMNQSTLKPRTEWYFERNIDEFSSSSGDGEELKRTPVAKRRVMRYRSSFPVVDAKESVPVSDVAAVADIPSSKRVEKADTSVKKIDSKAGNDDIIVDSVDSMDVDRKNGDGEILDLVESNSDSEKSAIGNGRRQTLATQPIASDVLERNGDVIDVDADEVIEIGEVGECDHLPLGGSGKDVDGIEESGPPPFNLHILCNSGESLEAMVERVGESYILQRVSRAQSEGRVIIGGEALGLDDQDGGVFKKFSETVLAGREKQTRKEKDLSDLTERAMRGEYQFNYRGRAQEENDGSGDGGRGRGRSRGGGRSRGAWGRGRVWRRSRGGRGRHRGK